MFKVTALLAAAATLLVQGDHWEYDHQDYWKHVSEKCAGKRQSPIDIQSTCHNPNVTHVDISLRIELSGYDQSIRADHFTLVNNGHSAQLSLENSDTTNAFVPKLSGSGVEGQEFQFTQLHFHWHATDDHQGSEHAIDGVRHAVEMHLVHFNTKYANISEAGLHNDGLAVVAVMFDVQEADNKNFDVITNSLGNVLNAKDSSKITGPVTLSNLLPKDFEVFYKYRGSLTTPPCSESVIWVVFPDVLKIGRKQLELFRQLENEPMHKLSVARGIQALGKRKITVSSPLHCEKAASPLGNRVGAAIKSRSGSNGSGATSNGSGVTSNGFGSGALLQQVEKMLRELFAGFSLMSPRF